jgi:hypothetical protein
MGYLGQVQRGKILKKLLITVMGPSGAGKTTFACDAPKPLVLQAEEGSNHLDVARTPLLKSYREALATIDELTNEKHEFETLVVDSLDQFELILWSDICKEYNVKEITELPYGKGYALALKVWQDLILRLVRLREKMNVIMICHSHVKTVNDPMKAAPYDRHELKLNQKAAALVKEISDAVLFATFEVTVREVKGGKAKASGDGTHILLTHGMPSHEGKNRFGLPYKLPLSFEAFMEGIKKSEPEDPQALISQINGLLDLVKDPETKKKATEAVAKVGLDSSQLSKILNRLEVLTSV